MIPDSVDVVPSGGFTSVDDWFTKFTSNKRKYVLGSVMTICAIAMTSRFQGALAEILRDALPAINALPVPLVKKLLLGMDKMSLKQIAGTLKTGLLSNELTTGEKLALVKKSIIHLVIFI